MDLYGDCKAYETYYITYNIIDRHRNYVYVYYVDIYSLYDFHITAYKPENSLNILRRRAE